MTILVRCHAIAALRAMPSLDLLNLEILELIKNDPSAMAALAEIMQNPANITRHMGNPTVQKLMTKLAGKMGGGAGAGGAGFPGFFGGEGAPGRYL